MPSEVIGDIIPLADGTSPAPLHFKQLLPATLPSTKLSHKVQLTMPADLALHFPCRGLSVIEGDSVFVHTRRGFFEKVSASALVDWGFPSGPPISLG